MEAEADYRRAWEAEERASALEGLRCSLPGLEQRVEACKRAIGELETHLGKLEKMREAFARELISLPNDAGLARLTAQEDTRIRNRRQQLQLAISALDGADARGTLVDHLWKRPRIPRTRSMIAEAREQLAKAENALESTRRQLA
jgi:hypothetical protein